MNDQLRKLYLMTARNSDFITQRTLGKYLPLKNDLINYDSLFELKQNLKEVEIAFSPPSGKVIQTDKNLQQNRSNPKLRKQTIKNNNKSSFRAESLLDVYKYEKSNKKIKKMKSIQNTRINNSITIIDNDIDPQIQNLQKNQNEDEKKFSERKVIDYKHKKVNSIELNELQLDSYIDQYLKQLMEEKNVNIKKQVELDRKLFIQKAIESLKMKIRSEKRHEVQNPEKKSQILDSNLSKTELVNKRPQLVKIKTKNQGELNIIEKSRIRRKPEMNQKRVKEKRKCKSTQLIPVSIQKQHINNSPKQQPMLPSLKSANSSQLATITHRSIYNSTPGSSFITKIELEAKNRERAQRVFRRKLLNMEKQHEKMVNNDCEYLET